MAPIRCPHCGEVTESYRLLCLHCGRALLDGMEQESPPPTVTVKKMSPVRIAAIIGGVWFAVGLFLALPTNSNPDSNAVGVCLGVPIMVLSVIPFLVGAIIQERRR